jgi:hypothetical protein
VAALSWQQRNALECRYDGPIPPWDLPSPHPAAILRRRMRLHRRLAADAIAELRHRRASFHPEGAARALRNLTAERRNHSRLAAHLGTILRHHL